ncbi:OTU domain-containing protein 5-A isoform X3, partial [Lates japonicus]
MLNSLTVEFQTYNYILVRAFNRSLGRSVNVISLWSVTRSNLVCVCGPGLTDWEDDEILASVLAVSQQEYLDSIKHQSAAMHREREPSPDSS